MSEKKESSNNFFLISFLLNFHLFLIKTIPEITEEKVFLDKQPKKNLKKNFFFGTFVSYLFSDFNFFG
jgi:hypothetical protein